MCNITKITYFQALINIISFFSSDRSQEKNTFNISWNFNNFKLKNFNIKKNFIKNFIKIYETFENIKNYFSRFALNQRNLKILKL